MPPALVSPGNVPSVSPATYTPDASVVTAKAWSSKIVPNCRVHTMLPAVSYFRRNASVPPALVSPGSVPNVKPPTYTPDASMATVVA